MDNTQKNMRDRGERSFYGHLFLMAFIILAVFIQQDIVLANQENDIIIFTIGSEEYRYTLEELSLIRMENHDDNFYGDVLYCTNISNLSYRLYCLSKEIYRPAVSACFTVNGQGFLDIMPETAGRELDLGLLITELANHCLYQKYYPLPVKDIQPDITTARLREEKPLHLWSQYTTVLADNPPRTENVKLAGDMLDQYLIKPGEEVSFNGIVGSRSVERGFRPAKVISGGGFVDGVGGGVCQVSTTLYNAVLLAGLEIKERHNHSISISYAPLGCDATVVYGHKDLVFKNNTPHFLMLGSKLEGLNLTISVYGPPAKTFDEIFIENKVLKTYPSPQEYVEDSTRQEGERHTVTKGQKGYLTETYRVTVVNGETKREFISRDYYAPLKTVILIGKPVLTENAAG